MANEVEISGQGSKEFVALCLLASIATNESGTAVNVKDGLPIISGKDRQWLLENYAACLNTIINRSA